MYAECPNCHAIFRVTPAILAQANGNVRCGECQTIFKATVENQESEASATEPVAPELGSSPETEQIDLTDEEMAELFSTDVEEEELAPRPPETSESLEESDIDSSPEPEAITEGSESEAPSEPGHQSELFKDQELPSEKAIDDPEIAELKTKPDSKQQDKNGFQNQASKAETSIFQNHTFLGLTALVLLFLLFGQYLHKNRIELSQYPSMRPMLETMCGVTGCDLPPRVSLGQIELLNHGIYSHPNESDALMIKATIVNHAEFKQPLPVIELSLSNIRGEKIALRRFGPNEYLPATDSVTDSLMESEKEISLSLQVKDPGKEALAFEFEFL